MKISGEWLRDYSINPPTYSYVAGGFTLNFSLPNSRVYLSFWDNCIGIGWITPNRRRDYHMGGQE